MRLRIFLGVFSEFFHPCLHFPTLTPNILPSPPWTRKRDNFGVLFSQKNYFFAKVKKRRNIPGQGRVCLHLFPPSFFINSKIAWCAPFPFLFPVKRNIFPRPCGTERIEENDVRLKGFSFWLLDAKVQVSPNVTTAVFSRIQKCRQVFGEPWSFLFSIRILAQNICECRSKPRQSIQRIVGGDWNYGDTQFRFPILKKWKKEKIDFLTFDLPNKESILLILKSGKKGL